MPPIRKTAPRWGLIAARAAGGLAILLVATYFSASYALNRYLHGEAFRALISEKTSAFLAADGHYEPIQINGFSFYSDSYTARGAANTHLKALKADQIRADFEPAALFEGAWKIKNLQIQRAKLELAGPEPSYDEASAVDIPSPALRPAGAAQRVRAQKRSWIPDRFELRQAKIEEAELTWSLPGRAGALKRSRFILEPNGRDLVVTGYGGSLTQTGLPTFAVDHFKLRTQYPHLYLTDSLLQLGDGESLNISGQAELGSARCVDFLVKYSGINISPYLPEDWRAGVTGKANGEARLSGTVDTIQATGTLTLSGAQMEALPILEKIAAFTRTRQFRQFALQTAEAEYVWTPSKLTVSRLNAESQGLIHLIGSAVIENGNVQGAFELGITPSSLKWLPGSRDRVFTQEHDGYAWTTLNISGPLNHLNEDLSARLTAAAGQQLINDVKGTLQNGVKTLFDLIKSGKP